jgi:hypothetical protein
MAMTGQCGLVNIFPPILRFVIASQRVRPEVAGPMTSSAKQSSVAVQLLDCFVASLLAMTAVLAQPAC